MKDLECPYCHAGNDVCHDDGFGYDEDQAHEMECDECGKNFVFHTSVIYSYQPRKADCLNGGGHEFTNWLRNYLITGIGEAQYRRCKACDHTERRVIP